MLAILIFAGAIWMAADGMGSSLGTPATVVVPQVSAAVVQSGREPGTPARLEPEGGFEAARARESALFEEAVNRHLRSIVRDGDPRQQVIALRMLVAASNDTAMRRRALAQVRSLLAESPNDPLLALALPWFCDPAPRVCTAGEDAAWAQVAPGNAAAWTRPLQAARGDPARTDALIASAAGGDRYDSHAHTLVLETVAMFDDMPLPPLGPRERRALEAAHFGTTDTERRRFHAAGAAFAVPMLPLTGITHACRPPLPQARIQPCRRVLIQMARGSTLIERAVAFGALERLMAGTPEGVHWAVQRRRLRWWSSQFSQVLTDAGYWDEFLRLGEAEAVRRALVRAGRPLDPPPGWRPPGG